jgi:hypoxanthine phosphoribosyltransferase
MIYSNLINRINKIDKSEFEPDAILVMQSWVKELEELSAKEELAQNVLIKEKLKSLESAIQEVDTILLSKSKMLTLLTKPHEIIALYDKKELYRSFIDSFSCHSRVEEIEKALEDM